MFSPQLFICGQIKQIVIPERLNREYGF